MQILPSIDARIANRHNAIWCSSFLAAWKCLCEDVLGGDVSLEGRPDLARSLNRADDPRPDVPDGSLFAAAGVVSRGIEARIRTGMQEAFPFRTPPSFPGIPDDSLVAYSCLVANVPFKIPYFQNRKPMEFTDSNGVTSLVVSFGIRSEDEYAYYGLRHQPRILFRAGEPCSPDLEFAVDLCADSSPSQIIVARIGREPTLRDALKRLEKEERIALRLAEENPEYAHYSETFGPNDVLLVPDISREISHRFTELEGRALLNRGFEGQRLDIAQQDIVFRLDRSGAELESESKMVCLPVPTFFVLDRPFLVVMRKRGSSLPYFAMWVDNAEILTPWKG